MANASDIFPVQRRTKLPGGYMGKILRVNLTTGSLKDENSPEEPLLRKLIGGQALAEYILLRELPLEAKPYGPESDWAAHRHRFDTRWHEGDGCFSQPNDELLAGPRRRERFLGGLPQVGGL